MSKSQIEQDLNVISFFNNLKNGFFLDIGAFDGISLSNTFVLEKKYNWTGICSEPGTEFDNLCKNRKVICDNKAVYSESRLTLEFKTHGMLSGITECLNGRKKNTVLQQDSIIVETITLQDLLLQYKVPKIIHYLSLDTEGSELKILKSVNFSDYIILYINVEHNYIEPNRSQIKTLLQDNGYFYYRENKWDDDYIHESVIIGVYYLNNDDSKPITITKSKDDKSKFIVSSEYWEDNIGELNNTMIKWDKIKSGKVFYNFIDYGNGDIWYKKDLL
tara:strand:- start:803 stop:1627 length:825 start_codon:yes stop_codon:yes gene_type:complete